MFLDILNWQAFDITEIHDYTQHFISDRPQCSSSSFSLVLVAPVLPPGSEQFDTETGQVIELLQLEALLKVIHKAVLWVQAKAHGPQDLCVLLAQVVKCVHQLFQVWMGVDHISSQYIVKTVCGVWETLLHLLTPGELGHLETQMRM